jgi:hypothetical protein
MLSDDVLYNNMRFPDIVLSRLFRWLIIDKLMTAHAAGKLIFLSALTGLTYPRHSLPC